MNEIKVPLMFTLGFLLFFGMMFGTAIYDVSLKQECRRLAMERNMSSAEIQAVCR
jgi:hypothetical protein